MTSFKALDPFQTYLRLATVRGLSRRTLTGTARLMGQATQKLRHSRRTALNCRETSLLALGKLAVT
eukprot:CAMPEP_0170497004 /NCGR_PEP_ID=MMETSP0208-20121228/23404_1 /TAXON_ID=197538 /ORGANISM="Strombidium inclinatum, Strain S3" /LENGTH=65 /DNA_ID=CAMNT_0010773681 /DNA_START=1 /DNA_END=194 /DNA_ORIENTATION=-